MSARSVCAGPSHHLHPCRQFSEVFALGQTWEAWGRTTPFPAAASLLCLRQSMCHAAGLGGEMSSSFHQCDVYIDSHLRRKIDVLAGGCGITSAHLSTTGQRGRTQYDSLPSEGLSGTKELHSRRKWQPIHPSIPPSSASAHSASADETLGKKTHLF